MISLAAAAWLASSVASSSFQSLQAGVYTDESNASRAVEQLRKAGYIAYFLIAPSPEQNQITYKVRVGRFADPGSAAAAKERLRALGFEKAFPVTTSLTELRELSGALSALIDANWPAIQAALGQIKPDGPLKRIRLYADDYLELCLLARPGERPGRAITSLGVWDTNPDPQRELFAVVDGARAYALFWDATQSCYMPALLEEGTGLTIGPDLDLIARRPERLVTVGYQRGGPLYRESGLDVYWWDETAKGYRQ